MADRELKLAIAHGPKCPHCGEGGFDDWWHSRGVRPCGLMITGSLKCHGCGKYFSVAHHADGVTHSTAWKKSA